MQYMSIIINLNNNRFYVTQCHTVNFPYLIFAHNNYYNYQEINDTC